MKTLLISVLAAFQIIAQQPEFNFNSPSNIKIFADHLFCEKDYLRAAEEYLRLNDEFITDTTLFKIGLSFYQIGNLTKSKKFFGQISIGSELFDDAHFQKNMISFLENPSGFYSVFQYDQYSQNPDKFSKNSYKLAMVSSLLDNNLKFNQEDFFKPFNSDEKNQIEEYFRWKNNPPKKNPVLAGILSTIIPGSGKIYSEEYGDGIVAFLTTGLLTFLAYDNFNAEHYPRGWIFASLAGLFYAGDIYGSISSAQIYNARISFEFKDGINIFLEKNNYFSPDYEFCK